MLAFAPTLADDLKNSGLNPLEQFQFLLDELMTAEDLNPSRLGKRINVAPPAIHRWVKEHNRPSRESFAKLCDAYPMFNVIRVALEPLLVDRSEGEGSRIRELENENKVLRDRLTLLQMKYDTLMRRS